MWLGSHDNWAIMLWHSSLGTLVHSPNWCAGLSTTNLKSTHMSNVIIRSTVPVLQACEAWEEEKFISKERIREVEHGTFSPLIFSCTGGMGPIAIVVYKRIAALLSKKNGQNYSKTLYLYIEFFSTPVSHHLFERIQIFLSPLWPQRISVCRPSACRG